MEIREQHPRAPLGRALRPVRGDEPCEDRCEPASRLGEHAVTAFERQTRQHDLGFEIERPLQCGVIDERLRRADEHRSDGVFEVVGIGSTRDDCVGHTLDLGVDRGPHDRGPVPEVAVHRGPRTVGFAGNVFEGGLCHAEPAETHHRARQDPRLDVVGARCSFSGDPCGGGGEGGR